MISVFASSVVDREFESRSCQTKDYKIGICCFFANHASIRGNNKVSLPLNHDNASEWFVVSVS